jgi:hypothetical protein
MADVRLDSAARDRTVSDVPTYNVPGTLQEFRSHMHHYVEIVVQSADDSASCCDVLVQESIVRVLESNVTRRFEANVLCRI